MRPMPHQHRIFQQRRAGAGARRGGRAPGGFVIGMPVAPPRRRTPGRRAATLEDLRQRVGQRVLVIGQLTVGKTQRDRAGDIQKAGRPANSYLRMVAIRSRSVTDTSGWAAPPSLTETT